MATAMKQSAETKSAGSACIGAHCEAPAEHDNPGWQLSDANHDQRRDGRSQAGSSSTNEGRLGDLSAA